MSMLSVIEIFEKLDKLNKPNLLRYMTNDSKNILPHFSRMEDTPLQQFLLSSLFSFDSILSGTVWIDKLHNCVKGIFFNV